MSKPLTDLRDFIIECYGLEDLRLLCFDLGVDCDDLPGEGKAAKAQELVVYQGRRRKFEELLAALQQDRPEPFERAGLSVEAEAVRELYTQLPIWETRDDPDRQRALRNRLAMLQLVHNTWIKGVLEQSLHGAAMIELGMEEKADLVEKPWDMIVQMPDREDRVLPPGTRMVDVFDETGGALLILGEPGSGKTTMLLELARQTIKRAKVDTAQPIPVVFSLSSWAAREQALADWLVDELKAKYNIPKKVAEPWVQSDELLLLLDGLDEVMQEKREACVRAINDFRQEHLIPLVVCSRIADYGTLTNRLRLQGAVVLKELSPEQMDQYLARIGVELEAIRSTLRQDAALRELARSPLTLSTIIWAYQDMSIEDMQSLNKVRDRRKHLLDAYLQRMFQRRSVDERYLPKQTVRWLKWLAQRMTERGNTLFLIERMQPGWLQSAAQRGLYATLLGLFIGLSSGPIFQLVFSTMRGVLIFTSIIGLIGGLGAWLERQSEDHIKTVEGFKWSWKKMRVEFLSNLRNRLSFGLISVLLGVLIGGVFVGLIAGLIVTLISVLIETLVVKEVEIRMVPNQGIRQSVRSSMIVGVIVGLIIGLIVGVGVGPLWGLVWGLVLGFGFGLFVGGGLAVIEHFTLRLILSITGHLPWRLITFLDYATERIFLRKVGGGYIFVHRTLMEYFASLEPEQ